MGLGIFYGFWIRIQVLEAWGLTALGCRLEISGWLRVKGLWVEALKSLGVRRRSCSISRGYKVKVDGPKQF